MDKLNRPPHEVIEIAGRPVEMRSWAIATQLAAVFDKIPSDGESVLSIKHMLALAVQAGVDINRSKQQPQVEGTIREIEVQLDALGDKLRHLRRHI